MKITLDSFLSVIERSGLIESDRLASLLAECREEVEAESDLERREQAGTDGDESSSTAVKRPPRVDAKRLAVFLVKRGELTTWQAEKLLVGKHKGYSLGKYRLLGLLGKGGMSSVYLAEHTVMKRRVAVKVLPHKRVNDASYLGRFHREAQAVAALDHRNIVRAYDVDEEVDNSMQIHFLVMEYVDGRSLQEIVAQDGPVDPRVAAEYIRQSALGLEHAHENGLVHRDIKPGNLLVDRSGTVKLLDLGLARFFDDTENSLTVEHDEKVLGTADYLAPEQAVDSHSVDHRADLYSLGCTLYFLLTGHPPFTEGSLAQRLIAHQTKEPPPVTDDRDDVPESLQALLQRLMKKDPDERPQSAAEVASLFEAWLSGQEVVPQAAPAQRPEPTVESELNDFFEDLEDRSGSSISSQIELSRKGDQSGRAKGRGRGGRGRSSRRLKGRTSDSTASATAEVAAAAEAVGTAIDASDTLPGEGIAPPTAPRRGSSSVIRRRQSSPLIPLLAAFGIMLLLGAGLYFLIDWASRSEQTPPGEASSPAGSPSVALDGDTGESASPAVAASSRPAPSGDVLGIGSDDSLPFADLAAALAWAGESGRTDLTLELAAGETFEELVAIDQADLGRFAPGLTIRTAEGQTPAVIKGTGGSDPVLLLRDAEGYTLQNVIIDAAGGQTGVEVAGFVSGTRLKNVTVRGAGTTAIQLMGVAGFPDRRLVLSDVVIEAGDAADGVRMTAGNLPTTHVMIDRLRVLGPASAIETPPSRSETAAGAGVIVENAVESVIVRNSIVAGARVGVKVEGTDVPLSNFRLVNNTFFRVNRAIVFNNPPAAGGKVSIIRNLFADLNGPEVVVQQPDDGNQLDAVIGERYGNVSDRQVDMVRDREVDVVSRRVAATFASDAASEATGDAFLRPTFEDVRLPQANPPYAGAVAPQ